MASIISLEALKQSIVFREIKSYWSFATSTKSHMKICGKIVVATKREQLDLLDTLHQRGQQNGLNGLKMIPAEALTDYEPHVAGLKGLWVPQTGIINYSKVADRLANLIQELRRKLNSVTR